MTERQAWQKLADGVVSGRYQFGLCRELATCCTTHGSVGRALSVAVRERMYARINNFRGGGAYRWSLDAAGQKARAAYCLRQVARLTPKRAIVRKKKMAR